MPGNYPYLCKDDAEIICQFHDGWLVEINEGQESAKNEFIKDLIAEADGIGDIGKPGLQ